MGEHKRHEIHETECIKKEAYALWDKNGRKEGHDVDHWLNAEKAVKSQTKK